MKKKNIILSIILNGLIILSFIFASIIVFTGFEFMHGQGVELEPTIKNMLRFFTVDSNIFMFIVAIIFLVYDILLLRKQIKKIPKKIYLLKLMSTSGVALTLSVVMLYLQFIVKGGLWTLLMNSNIFLHLVIPVLSIITFVFFEKTNELKFKDTFYGLVPMGLYGLFYITNVLIHTHHWQVSPKYDFYYFVYNGVWKLFIVLPIIFGLNYLISYLLYRFNNKAKKS